LGDPEKTHRHSIKSEFEKNSVKYGFKFVDVPENHDKLLAWKNETWDATNYSFSDTWNTINRYIDEHKLRKSSIWNLGNLQLLGYDKSYLLKTSVNDYNFSELKTNVRNVYQQYYDLLINL
jgi:hypothetical protein